MNKTTLASMLPPGEFIREELESRGWTQTDFAAILGRPLAAVNEVIRAKRGVTPEMAKAIAEAFGTSAEFWMNLESQYQLSRVLGPRGAVQRRARLFEKTSAKKNAKPTWRSTKRTGLARRAPRRRPRH
jgi:HTH-type transcriptional regulator / antitoxin HigA